MHTSFASRDYFVSRYTYIVFVSQAAKIVSVRVRVREIDVKCNNLRRHYN